jgi:release factor glutamine methyltransferase
VTVLEVIKRSADFLAKKGVDSPRLQVELLLAQLLGMPRMKLYLNFERVLTEKELEDLRALVQRRGQREPLQQIIGSTSFCGLEIAVNAHVLVPRPETELLAEEGWKFLESAECGVRSAESKNKDATVSKEQLVLDFATGSGCITIAIAVKCPQARIVATDISPDALAIAHKNATAHKVDARIQFVAGDGLAILPAQEKFDLIVSNPPYIPTREIAGLDPEVRDHDPRLALDGGTDGLDFYRRLAREAAVFLKPGGRIMLELGAGQAAAVEKLFTQQKWIVEAVKKDYSGIPRILIAKHVE